MDEKFEKDLKRCNQKHHHIDRYLIIKLCKLDIESKKIISARILSKLGVSVAKGNSKYVSKFQVSSSNSLGVMPFFVKKIEDQKGDRFHRLFVENLAPAEVARVQELREAKFSKSKKRIENHFFEVVLSGHKK